ncbi:MAG: prepilin-type N-terminal cleavage/methylation domain-containing protein [Candidatus Adlerbacteria bacterium]|nr:prepilin-type N-terminal cleavage/methylation domain-containing protein [Candidatus Adlerbacteria bacterium]
MINKPANRGFTLIETMVAVLILATAIAGPLTIASKSLIAAVTAKDQVSAFFLAQDGIEFMRFARDTNKLQDSDWLAGTGVDLSNCLSTDGCYVDTTSAVTPASCSTFCPLLQYDSSINKFSYTSGVNTIFRRTIQLEEIVADVEALLTVTVSWSAPGVTGAGCPTGTRCVVVQENLFNWQ